MFPQQSIYRPVDGVGTAGLGAYFKPQYERPIAGLGRGFGADDDSSPKTITTNVSNQTSAVLLIGLGALVIVGGFVFLGPKRMHANAARRKKSGKRGRSYADPYMAKRRRKKRTGRVTAHKGAAGKTYAYWAKIMRRDLDAGYLTPGEVDESLRVQYDKDEGDYRRSGIRSASQFVKGVRAKL